MPSSTRTPPSLLLERIINAYGAQWLFELQSLPYLKLQEYLRNVYNFCITTIY